MYQLSRSSTRSRNGKSTHIFRKTAEIGNVDNQNITLKLNILLFSKLLER